MLIIHISPTMATQCIYSVHIYSIFSFLFERYPRYSFWRLADICYITLHYICFNIIYARVCTDICNEMTELHFYLINLVVRTVKTSNKMLVFYEYLLSNSALCSWLENLWCVMKVNCTIPWTLPLDINLFIKTT